MGRPDPQDLVPLITELLEKKRRKLGISHEMLAAKAGIHRSTISRVESLSINGTLLVFLSMAQALDASLGDIIKSAERKYQQKRTKLPVYKK
jgi:predicted transcriptional regulator